MQRVDVSTPMRVMPEATMEIAPPHARGWKTLWLGVLLGLFLLSAFFVSIPALR